MYFFNCSNFYKILNKTREAFRYISIYFIPSQNYTKTSEKNFIKDTKPQEQRKETTAAKFRKQDKW